MKLSIYTCVKDAIYWDLHALAMLKHHLPLADEIVVNEGYSTDGTFEAIQDLDPKIKVFRSHWPKPGGLNWYNSFKDEARRRCTGDWCMLVDCDEFVPEWDFERLRARLSTAKEDLLSVSVINFYGNYRVFHARPQASNWPAKKMILSRNRTDVEAWGDGANVRIAGQRLAWPETEGEFVIHHFGMVRHAPRLREKWRNQQGRVYGTMRLPLPNFVFRWLPHRWDDPDFFDYLEVYDGPYIRAVVEDPDEFVRDDFRTYDAVRARRPARSLAAG
jgi:glycosyltransferase involved in cell wall biosynthesis